MTRSAAPLPPRRTLKAYLSYRGGEGMVAWAFHRASGIGVWAFIILHVFDIWLIGANPSAYDFLGAIYSSPPGRLMETLLGAALASMGIYIFDAHYLFEMLTHDAGATMSSHDFAVARTCCAWAARTFESWGNSGTDSRGWYWYSISSGRKPL